MIDPPDDYLEDRGSAETYFYADAYRIDFLTVGGRYFGWVDRESEGRFDFDLEAGPLDVIFGLYDDRRPQKIIGPVVEWMVSENIQHKAFYLDLPEDRAIAVRFKNPVEALRAINLFPDCLAKRNFWVWSGREGSDAPKLTPHTVVVQIREEGEAWCAEQASGYWRVSENQMIGGDQTVMVDGVAVTATGRMVVKDWTFHFESDRDAALFKMFMQ